MVSVRAYIVDSFIIRIGFSNMVMLYDYVRVNIRGRFRIMI